MLLLVVFVAAPALAQTVYTPDAGNYGTLWSYGWGTELGGGDNFVPHATPIDVNGELLWKALPGGYGDKYYNAAIAYNTSAIQTISYGASSEYPIGPGELYLHASLDDAVYNKVRFRVPASGQYEVQATWSPAPRTVGPADGLVNTFVTVNSGTTPEFTDSFSTTSSEYTGTLNLSAGDEIVFEMNNAGPDGSGNDNALKDAKLLAITITPVSAAKQQTATAYTPDAGNFGDGAPFPSPWSYGYGTNLGGGTDFTPHDTPVDVNGGVFSQELDYDGSYESAIAFNTSLTEEGVYVGFANDYRIAPEGLFLHADQQNDIYTKVRFTAPSSGLYDVTATWSPAPTLSGSTGGGHVITFVTITSPAGTSTEFTHGPGSGASFDTGSSPLYLEAGDDLVFEINNAGNYNGDGKLLDIHIEMSELASCDMPTYESVINHAAKTISVTVDAGAGNTLAQVNFVNDDGNRKLDGLTASLDAGGLVKTYPGQTPFDDYQWKASGSPTQTATFTLSTNGSTDDYAFFAEIINSCGVEGYIDPQGGFDSTPTAREDGLALPTALTLDGNYPNPFNPQTTIRYGLPESGTVRLAVYDVMGREVRVLVDGVQVGGWYEATFEAADLPSGAYLYRLEAGAASRTGRMLLLK